MIHEQGPSNHFIAFIIEINLESLSGKATQSSFPTILFGSLRAQATDFKLILVFEPVQIHSFAPLFFTTPDVQNMDREIRPNSALV